MTFRAPEAAGTGAGARRSGLEPGGRGVGLMLVREVLSRQGFPFTLATHPEGGAEFEVRFAGS